MKNQIRERCFESLPEGFHKVVNNAGIKIMASPQRWVGSLSLQTVIDKSERTFYNNAGR
jgi:hypothetical protein